MSTTEQKQRKANHLVGQRSPYLQQHLYNPVDWYPWQDSTFDLAKQLNKPLLISIGYSTCHWCHVMERESFEDEETAAALNDAFVCVKVDREERPDVDSVYMGVCTAVKGNGGWPLTVVVTADKRPFYITTYLSKRMLMATTQSIKQLWETNHDNVAEMANQIIETMNEKDDGDFPSHESQLADNTTAALSAQQLDQVAQKAVRLLGIATDPVHGGFGRAPKFPSPHILSMMMTTLLHHNKTDSSVTMGIVEKTLKAMHRGGIWDHVGKGFHRYTTDSEWNVPHFEKMLYDQAGIAMACMDAFQITHDAEYSEIAQEIFSYVLRDLKSKEESGGGFYSAEDADSEGVEGKFYLWSEQQLRDVLGESRAAVFLKFYEGKKTDDLIHEEPIALHIKSSAASPTSEEKAALGECLAELEAVRSVNRVRPHLDKNILTDWNSFMAIAFARGARVLGHSEYSSVALQCIQFLINKMWNGSTGDLLHHYKDGHASIAGNLDDYAFFLWALCECHQLAFDQSLLDTAKVVAGALNERFMDHGSNSFRFTAVGHDIIPGLQQTESHDSAVPSGASAAVRGLLLLGMLVEEEEYKQQAESVMKTTLKINTSQQQQQQEDYLMQTVMGHAQMLSNLDLCIGPSFTVVIACPTVTEAQAALQVICQQSFCPRVTFSWDHGTRSTKTTSFFACSGTNCLPPVTTIPDLIRLFNTAH